MDLHINPTKCSQQLTFLHHDAWASRIANFSLTRLRAAFNFISLKKREKKPIYNTQAHAQTHMHTNSTLTQPYIFWNMSVTANDKNEVAQVAP